VQPIISAITKEVSGPIGMPKVCPELPSLKFLSKRLPKSVVSLRFDLATVFV
jgi:hypothetical protein